MLIKMPIVRICTRLRRKILQLHFLLILLYMTQWRESKKLRRPARVIKLSHKMVLQVQWTGSQPISSAALFYQQFAMLKTWLASGSWP